MTFTIEHELAVPLRMREKLSRLTSVGQLRRGGRPVLKVVRMLGLLTCYRERDALHSKGGSSEFATSLRYARACSDVLSLPSSISSTSSDSASQVFVLTL